MGEFFHFQGNGKTKWFNVETRIQAFNNLNLNVCCLTETKMAPKVTKLKNHTQTVCFY